MSHQAAPTPRDVLGLWCGGVLIFGAALTPLLAWLSPISFAGLLALVGLLSLPAIRLRTGDRPALIALLAALLWAAVSTTWTVYHPKNPTEGQAAKLALELPIYWAAICGARRADPRLARIALLVLAWGLAALGGMLAVEAVAGGRIYKALHDLYEPIRIDLAGKNLGQSTFVLALLWPLAAVGARRAGASWWLALPMALGAIVGALAFDADAPAMAVVLALLVALAAIRWPTGAPRTLGGIAAVAFLIMPAAVLGIRGAVEALNLRIELPASWSMRLGYWNRAVDWTAEHPVRGWGLDASRAFSPGIQLHPHNGPLQVWLELGAVGALIAAAFWWLALSNLARPRSNVVAAAAAASASVYLLFSGVNFGVWQEWWLALGALCVLLGAAVSRVAPARPSTRAPISE